MSKKFDDWNRLLDFMKSTASGVTLKEIMNEFDISLRTAQRWVQEVGQEYPYIQEDCYNGKEKRWYLSERLIDRKLSITASDLLILRQSAECLKQQNLLEQANALSNLENKLTNIFSKKNSQIVKNELQNQLFFEGLAFKPGPRFILDAELLKQLREALVNKKIIKINYFNKLSKKQSINVIEPHGLLYGERNHYLLARHNDDYYGDEIHHFILHNIKSIELLDTTFQPLKDFNLKDYCQDMFGVFKELPFNVEWRFNKAIAHEVKSYIFHPSQKMKENSDGSITVKFKAGGALEMSWHLYMWGDMVEVIKPIDFWQRVEGY